MTVRKSKILVTLLGIGMALTAAAHHGDAGRYEETITTLSARDCATI